MSFVSTFNSLSTNGWSAKGSSGYSPIYVLANTNVGEDVAISEDGNYVIASNSVANSAGIVKVYTVNNNVLINQANVIGNLEGSNAVLEFGSSIDIDYDGTRFIGGAPQTGPNAIPGPGAQGAARIYVRSGTSWSYEQQINAPTSNCVDFGSAVSINNNGDVIAVAESIIYGTQTVRTFSRSGNTWSSLANIPAPTANNIFFGCSISLDGNNTLAVGAYRANNNGTYSGAAYVYDSTSGSLLATLLASDGAANDNFGAQVDISNDGNTIVVTAPGVNSSTGAAYVYKGSGNSWTEVQKLLPFGNVGTFGVGGEDTTPQGISGNGSIIAISATFDSNITTANYTSLLTYIDSSNNNNYISTQQIQYPAAQYFGTVVDINYSGSLMITSAGNNSLTGNLILLGP
jgi:hypothetical protein